MAEAEPVIVVGAGLSGLATALGVALGGRRVVLLEAADKVGGAAAYSGGQVWVGANHVAAREGIDDDLTATEQYVRGIAHVDPSCSTSTAMRRFVDDRSRRRRALGAGRCRPLGVDPWPGRLPRRGGRCARVRPVPDDRARRRHHARPWRDRLLVSPYFRMGTTYADMFEEGRRHLATTDGPAQDTLTLGTGAGGGVPPLVLLEEPTVELLAVHPRHGAAARGRRPRRSGVRGGGTRWPGDPPRSRRAGDQHVRLGSRPRRGAARLGPGHVRQHGTGQRPRGRHQAGPRRRRRRRQDPATLRADGARVASPTTAAWSNGPEYAMPHAMIVDRAGRRFCNDSYWVDLVPKALAEDDPHLPFFLILDEQHHRKYGLGSTAPGGRLSERRW